MIPNWGYITKHPSSEPEHRTHTSRNNEKNQVTSLLDTIAAGKTSEEMKERANTK